jgi:hypothetical protein
LFLQYIHHSGFSGTGSGTAADPYHNTLEQLREMNDDLDAHYILMNDIDASATRNWNVGDHDENPATPDSAMGWEPVGSSLGFYFSGRLNGNSHKITNLTINRPTEGYIGLFARLNRDFKIENIEIQDANIIGNEHVGIIAGWVELGTPNVSAEFSNCNISGNVTGNSSIGGF